MSDQNEKQESPQEVGGNENARLDALEASSVTFSNVIVMCFATVILAVLVVATVFNLGARNGYFQMGGQTKVVYLDFDKVMDARIEATLSQKLGSVEQTRASADLFQREVSDLIASYAAGGYVVINKKALITGGEAADITPQFIQKLGMK